MKELRIGVIGTGAIGKMHIRHIKNHLKGGKVTAVSDVNQEGAKAIAAEVGAEFIADGNELIASDKIDAVLVAAWDPAHKDYVLECLKHGKYVFCEKPLAIDSEGCRAIVEQEMAGGKRLVQVGFMRRYDTGYRQLKQAIQDNCIGRPLMVHCAHRNKSVGENYEDDYVITQCCIHEIDLLQWLLDDDYHQVQVLLPGRTSLIGEKYHDPQIALIETKKGIHIDIELFNNCQFGYDIRCEVVGETGSASLPDPSRLQMRKDLMQGTELCASWENRFIDAYLVEIQEWIDSVLNNKAGGPSSWDGYLASVTADTLIASRGKKVFHPVEMPQRPDFYS